MRRVRIFVSSPADCSAERQVLDEVVARINRSESDRTGLFLQVFKWEDDVVPRIGPPPQTVVDDQTPFCDIYLGIMSSRFGGDGTRESGTKEEFRQALERFGATGRPWIFFYFNQAPPLPTTPDEAQQWVKVLELRRELEPKGIVGTYAGARGSADGFFEKVELHLRLVLRQLELAAASTNALTAGSRRGAGGSAATLGEPVVPVEYTAWLQSTKCANVDLFGLEPKHGSAAKLHSIYVPLTTTAGGEVEDAGKGGPPRRTRKPLREVDMRGREREQPTLLLDRLAKESLYVPGAPGSGKSTFCRWVAWLACEGRLPSALAVNPPEGYRETSPAAFAGRLPVLVHLRELWSALPQRPRSRDLARADLETTLADWVESRTEGLPGAMLRSHLAHGSALLVLDGVDEVPVAAGEGHTQWAPRALLLSGLSNACRAWTAAGNRLLVTSRPYGLTTSDVAAIGLATAPVHDLDPGLRELLVRRWFHQLRPAGQRESYADRLIGHLGENAWLEPLSVNPLLLTGMCIVYDEGGRLPQDKHDLYTRIVNTVLGGRYRDNVEERERARYRLQAIAYGMHTGHGLGEVRSSPMAEVSLADLDRMLSDYLQKSRSKEEGAVAVVTAREELLSQSGLFLDRGDGKAGFYHLSFQEFLAGQRITDVEDDVFRVFDERSESPEWHNTLSLLFAGLTRERAARLVAKIVGEFRDDDTASRQLGLQTVASDCLDILHARGVRLDQATETRSRHVFLSTMLSAAPAAVRCRVGSTLGRFGDPRFHDERLGCLPSDPMLGFIEIPAREFVMGGKKDGEGSYGDEHPEHRIELSRFFIARYQTTVAQFSAFASASSYAPADPRCLHGAPNHPVAFVTWHDAMAYCRWLALSMRRWPQVPAGLLSLLAEPDPCHVTLPSEAQWERAARGVIGRRYPWGDDIDPDRANFADVGITRTSPVGAFPRGATPRDEGAAEDLSGNVWEWTRSHFAPYPYLADDGREKLDAGEDIRRVVRGGSFGSGGGVRAARRHRSYPADRSNSLGFRVVVSPFSSESA